MSAPVFCWLVTAQGKPKDIPYPTTIAMHNPLSTKRRQVASAQVTHQSWAPIPNPQNQSFSQIYGSVLPTPLPTLFYTPEAANLGDLMMIWVRPRVRIITSFGVSKTSRSTPDTPDNNVCCRSFSPIARHTDVKTQAVFGEQKAFSRLLHA